jgi:hypothetical protein
VVISNPRPRLSAERWRPLHRSSLRQANDHLTSAESGFDSRPRHSSLITRSRGVALSAETLNYSNEVIGFKRLVEDISCAGHN